MGTSSTGFMPPPLVNAIKGELINVGREGSTRTVLVEYWIKQGLPVEARVRNREALHIICLSS